MRNVTHGMNLLPFLIKLHNSVGRQVRRQELFYMRRVEDKPVKSKDQLRLQLRLNEPSGCFSATQNGCAGTLAGDVMARGSFLLLFCTSFKTAFL